MKTNLALAFALALATRAQAADDPETVCRAHLRNLGAAVKAYELVHNKQAPTKLSALYLEGWADSYGDFVCPASGTSITLTTDIDTKSDYELGTGDILVREKAARHGGKALAVFADGTIKQIEAPAAAAMDAVPKNEPEVPARVHTPPPPARGENPANNSQVTTPTGQPRISVVDQGELRGDLSEMMGLAFAFQNDGRLTVASVKKNSIADTIGINTGDTVTEINQRPVPQVKQARPIGPAEMARLAGVSPDDELLVTIRRASDGVDTVLSLSNGKPEPPQLIPPGTQVMTQRTPPAPALGAPAAAYLGAKLMTNRDTGAGALVLEVVRDGPAESSGLKAGDLIVALDGEPIESSQQVVDAIAKRAVRDQLNLLVIREGKSKKVTVTLGGRPSGR